MNWRVGLTRVYVAFWVALAVGGAIPAYQTTLEILKPWRELNSFLHAHKSVALGSLKGLPTDVLFDRLSRSSDWFTVNAPGPQVPDSFFANVMMVTPKGETLAVSLADLDTGAKNGWKPLQKSFTPNQVAILSREAGVDEAAVREVVREEGLTVLEGPELDLYEELALMKETANRAEPWGELGRVWVLWGLIVLVAPGIVLLAVRWIWDGFARSQHP